MDFKVGEVVKLKSGGPQMTITSIGRRYESSPLEAWCTWFKSDNQTAVEVLPLEAIELISTK